MTVMNRQVIAYALIALAAIASQPASAADTASNWTGFYVGANAGYAWGTESNSLSIADGPTAANCHFCSILVGGNDAGLAQSAGSSSFDPHGFVGGAQLGYNWQQANWVYGLELDFESFNQRQSNSASVQLPANSVFGNCGAVACVGNFSSSVKADWLLTIRPRIGYAWNNTLVYGTAGLAVSRLSFAQTYRDNIFLPFGMGGSESSSASSTRLGWTVGAGLEQAMGKNWSAKLEYLYVRFDGLNSSGVLHDFFPADTASFSNNIDHLSSNIVRVGLNYKFGPSY
jgi:outer membrane immunogenic protein